MSQKPIRIIILAILLLACSHKCSAANSDTLTVAISLFPPCIMQTSDGFEGFDIDLWEMIADELGFQYKYKLVEFENIFDDLTSGRSDLALAGITINSEREKIVDFSQHYLDSGLRIMVPVNPGSRLLDRLSVLLSPAVIKGFLYLIFFIIICGHVLWLSEKGSNAISDKYMPGIFEAFWCIVATVTTVGYGDIAPRRWMGRLAAFLVMISGIGLFGWIVGEFAAVATVQKMQSSISSPADLRGRTVATMKATTSIKVLKDVGARTVAVKHIEDAYEMLEDGKVEAVVYDAPSLLYYANNKGSGKVAITGEIFDRQYYGIAFPEGSSLREPVNRALLKLRERKRGVSLYDYILSQWFGDSQIR